MASVNKVTIIGRLGQDPEMRYASSGDAICNISVATSENWKDKNTGERREKTEWHRIVLFGKVGEIAGEYLRKGSQAYFEGKLTTRKWQDQSGQDRYTTEIVVDSINGKLQLLDARRDGDGQQGQQGQQQEQRPQGNQYAQQTRQEQRPAPQRQQPPANMMDMDDDIPF